MEDWKNEVRRQRAKRYSVARISRSVKVPEEAIRELYRQDDLKKKKARVDKKKSGKQPAKKFEAIQNFTPVRHELEWDGHTRFTFGLIGDTHLNSKYTQLTHLHKFYDLCVKRGVKNVYHTGDIDEGEQMRTGHQYDCYTQGADEHIREIVKNYPSRDEIITHFITGNHDSSIYKSVGIDIGKIIAAKRSDMHYLGRDWAKIEITPNCVLELRHPWDGSAYAISYKPQKMIESMEADSKPNLLAIGHYHKLEYLFHRNVHSFQTGCFQSQTPFTRGKGISVHLGGWIVTIEVDKNGYIRRIAPEMIPFYKGIDRDYTKWER